MILDKNILSGKELFEKLNNENWDTLIPRLHYYALNKLERYDFLYNLYDVKNLSTYMADEAIRMVWEQERKWNNNYYKNLYDFLKGIVDSLISNFIKSKEVNLTENLPENEHEQLSQVGDNPEEAYISNEIEQEIMAILNDDIEAKEVFECLKDGLKPKEIAGELGMEIINVYNILKRVQRKLKHYQIQR